MLQEGKCKWLDGLYNHLAPRKVPPRSEGDAVKVLLHAVYQQIDAGLTVLIEDCSSNGTVESQGNASLIQQI